MLLKLKRLLSNPIYAILKRYHLLVFKQFLKSHHKNIYIFDLDNTLADTYPYLKTNIGYDKIPAHQGMINILKKKIVDNQFCIILSARDYRVKSVTRKWLEVNLELKKEIPLFLVPTAADKLSYLRFADKTFENTYYYDDLSYNHENGEVKFYHKVIETLKNTSIHYYGYDEINIINQQKEY